MERSHHKIVDTLNNIINNQYIQSFELSKDELIEVMSLIKQQNTKIKDILNWVQSDLAQEEQPKLGRTATLYRSDKLRFLRKLKELLLEIN